MDGVIVDSEPLHERAFREVFHELGYGGTHGMDFATYYGRSDRALWVDFIAKHHPPQPLAELLALKQNRLIEILRRERPIFAGLPELLAALASCYPLAIASGSSHPVIDEVLELSQLRRFFPVVVSIQDVGRGKPAPDVFLRAAELLSRAPETCAVIEDSSAGVEAARAAGMEVVAITNTLPRELLSHATRVVDSYQEIADLFLPEAAHPAFRYLAAPPPAGVSGR